MPPNEPHVNVVYYDPATDKVRTARGTLVPIEDEAWLHVRLPATGLHEEKVLEIRREDVRRVERSGPTITEA
jgi:hypothetical protein